MARKNVVESHKMLDSVDISTNQTSSETNVLEMDRGSISLDWTGDGSLSGTIEVQAKKQKKTKAVVDSDWSALDFGATITVSGVSGHHDLILDALDFTEIRIVFTSSAGTGTLDATLTLKQVGG